MDIIPTLTTILKDLMSKRSALHNKIIQDKKLLEKQKVDVVTLEENLKKEIADLQNEIVNTQESIKNAEQELGYISKTIEQTESGYKKILEAGETLMCVVAEQVTEYKNIDYKPINSNSAFN